MIYIVFAVVVLFFIYAYIAYKRSSRVQVEEKTMQWIDAVTKKNDPLLIYNTFCADGILLGTLSDKIKTREDIKKYFEFFAKLPNLRVVNVEHNIVRVTDDVYVNNAMIQWMYGELTVPLTARMTFIFRRTRGTWCIFELHSSELPAGI